MPEEYKMTDVWKMKLRELRFIQAQMQTDSNTTPEELHDIQTIIEYVRKELAKAMIEEKKEEKVTSIGKRS
jgi:hypothetical protein